MAESKKAPQNRTIVLNKDEKEYFLKKIIRLNKSVSVASIINKTIIGNFFKIKKYLPNNFVDLLIVDPPYNLHKNFNTIKFKGMNNDAYSLWFESFFTLCLPLLKENASIYICSDWKSSIAIQPVLEKHVIVRNRITWEREKGRGSKTNWKNNTEDIWFATRSDKYIFNVDDVKVKRKVLAPYKREDGKPKDWAESDGNKYRLTHPSNIWTDITVPFWSMQENTDHPTQKPEKLIAKLILASSNKGDVVLDPFLGSGTTSAVAKKLERNFIGIELDEDFACLAEKRLKLAEDSDEIQGYSDGVFWERNTLSERENTRKKKK